MRTESVNGHHGRPWDIPALDRPSRVFAHDGANAAELQALQDDLTIYP
jgi:hypothetical protein